MSDECKHDGGVEHVVRDYWRCVKCKVRMKQVTIWVPAEEADGAEEV
jgi:hypothetical protein